MSGPATRSTGFGLPDVLGWLGRIVLALPLAAITVWGALALHFQGPDAVSLRIGLIALWLGLLVLAIVSILRGRMAPVLAPAALALLGMALWWQGITPSNDRDWQPETAQLLTGAVDASDPSRVALRNVRNFDWRTLEDFDAIREDRSYDLDALTGVDMILSFWTRPIFGHTLVSFGFEDGRHLVFSVEVRKEAGERYSALAGLFRSYEIAIVAAEERDVVRLRTSLRGEDVSLYRVALGPESRKRLFLDYVAAANDLAAAPKFYNTLFANCTTRVFRLIRQNLPHLPLDAALLLNGRLPDYLFDLGALDMRYPLEALREMSAITAVARSADPEADFSAAIRAGIPELPVE